MLHFGHPLMGIAVEENNFVQAESRIQPPDVYSFH